MSESMPATPSDAVAAAPAAKPFIRVAAGLILRPDGQLLLAQRPSDKPWAGWWELPGGKIEAGESTLEALARELDEELGIRVTDASPWVTYTHEYPKNIVELAFCRVYGWTGIPTGRENQELAWVDPKADLPVGPLLPATEPPMRWLQLPEQYLITSIGGQQGLAPYLEKLARALQTGIRLVQFREPSWMAVSEHDAYAAFKRIVQLCHDAGARCLVNSCHPESWWAQADGVHFRAADARAPLAATSSPPGDDEHAASAAARLRAKVPGLIAVSAHDIADLTTARALGADFAVLGHVLDTPSHPGQPGMGWEQFTLLAAQAGLPVFAIGGQSPATQADARQHGAHGIAGMRHLIDQG
ncbi:Nudix family hydrolase [Pollutimonas sp. H1-120]|uniref:Nudix family hydrolase n=1 Tax=Pollutimonas sp. H1-120 TaxID=3148824 RepID=UPI003B51C548